MNKTSIKNGDIVDYSAGRYIKFDSEFLNGTSNGSPPSYDNAAFSDYNTKI